MVGGAIRPGRLGLCQLEHVELSGYVHFLRKMVEQEWVSAETEVIRTGASEVVGCTWKGTLSNSESGVEVDIVIFARGREIYTIRK